MPYSDSRFVADFIADLIKIKEFQTKIWQKTRYRR